MGLFLAARTRRGTQLASSASRCRFPPTASCRTGGRAACISTFDCLRDHSQPALPMVGSRSLLWSAYQPGTILILYISYSYSRPASGRANFAEDRFWRRKRSARLLPNVVALNGCRGHFVSLHRIEISGNGTTNRSVLERKNQRLHLPSPRHLGHIALGVD